MNKMLISKKLITLFLLLVNVFAYSQFVTTGIATSNSLYSGGNIGVGFTTLPVFGTNKFIVTGNSLFTGNTTVNGTGQFANLGLGVLPNTIYRLNVTGNSLFTGTTAFTGNTTVSGTSQIANLGLGVLPNTAFRLNVTGNSLFTGTTQTTGNVGIGIAPSAALSTKLSLASGIQGLSGLQFSNLTSAFVPTSSTNKFLTVDASGNVVLLNTTQTSGGNTITAGANITATGSPTTGYTISSPSQVLSQSGNTVSLSNGGGSVTFPTSTDSQTLSVAGNQLSISNGNTVTLPTISNTNLYNSNGTITNSNGTSGRNVNLNNNFLKFSGNEPTTNTNNTITISPFGNTSNPNSDNRSIQEIKSDKYYFPNFDGIGINTNKVYGRYESSNGGFENRLTNGFYDSMAWLQVSYKSGTFYGNNKAFSSIGALSYLINPLGGNVGIGLDKGNPLGTVTGPTAVLHTKGSLKLDSLGDAPPTPDFILGTDANNQVFQFPASSLTPNNVNIYTDNGDLQDYRTVNLNQKSLTFLDNQSDFSNRLIIGSEGNVSDKAINVIESTKQLAPNLGGGGFNRNELNFQSNFYSSRILKTEGVFEGKSWIQTSGENYYRNHSVNDKNYRFDTFGPGSYLINPLGGNVGIGLDVNSTLGTVTDPTAVLHTLGRLRFQNLPDGKKPNAILGTDTDGNVFEYDPSQFGGGANENIYNTDGSLTDPRTLSLNDQTLTFQGNVFNQVYNNNVSINNCTNGTSGESFSTIDGNGFDVGYPQFIAPDFNKGYFKLRGSAFNRGGTSGSQLNFGVGANNTWLQSSSFRRTHNDVITIDGLTTECTNTASNMYLNPLGGKVSIGTTNINLDADCPDCNNYRLFVAQGIRTEKVRVDIASVKGWADYVFAKDYSLMPLNDLEKYIKTNGHLPNIPKAEEVVKEGIDLGAMDAKLLEKIEELTIHTIELNKKNEALEKEKIKQAKLIDDLAKRLEKLEKNTKQ